MAEMNPAGGLSFRIAAAIICMTCIFYSAVMRTLSRKRFRTRLFMILLFITLIDSLSGIVMVTVKASDLPYRARYIIIYCCEYIYYLTHMIVAPIFWLYIAVVCDVYHHFKKNVLMLLMAPFAILEIAVITNPATHFIFLMRNDLSYSRGVGIYVAYFISGLYLLFCAYLLWSHWRTMNILQRIAMFYFLGLALIGILIQMLFPEIISELICEALGLMGIMIMIERDDYRLDYKTNANNRGALVLDLRTLIETGRSFYVICVKVINTEMYRRVIGYDNFDQVTIQLANFLLSLDDNDEVYRTTGGQFFMICKDADRDKVYRMLDAIEERLRQSFDTGTGPANIKAKVLCAKCPEELNADNDILLLQDANVDDTDKIVLKGKDIDFLFRRIAVEKAIVRSMNNDTFRVMYQPVYDKETLRIVSADVLLMLKDVELGEIKFSEFMAVAEDSGFVEELEYRMIESVFRFLKAGVARSGIDISTMVIHIMSVQVIKEELVNRVEQLLKKYEVDPSIILFDVSDQIAVQAREELMYVIDRFREMNIRCMMVNTDPGFMGMGHSIIDKLDGIVINVKRIIESSGAEQGEIVLRNRISMISQLGKVVVLSGIDDKQCYDLVRDVHVKSILGDYMCVPVTKNELQTKFWHGEVFYEKN